MRLNIRHVTTYRYDPPARGMSQRIKLFPSVFEGQAVPSWAVTVNGAPVSPNFKDGYGDQVALVSARDHVETCEIVAEGVVETQDRAGVVNGLRAAAHPAVFLRETAFTEADEAIEELAKQADEDSPDPLSLAHLLCARIGEAIEYQTGETEATTTAAEALEAGKGVCQDHAHVFISAMRSLNVPARYVSGYLFTAEDGPHAAAHAWAESWVAGVGWVGFDAANALCPTDAYVRIACGLDARDAAPIRGAVAAGSEEAIDVAVTVQQSQEQIQQ